MEEEPTLSSSPVSEAELDRLSEVLEELHHLLESAPHSMVQPPGKAFPTTARITGPQERDNPYPTLYRCSFGDYLRLHDVGLQTTDQVCNFCSSPRPGICTCAIS